MTKDPLHYAKGIVAIVGTGITTALGLIPEGSATWTVLTILAAMITTLGVFLVPNRESPPEPTQLPA